MKKVFIVTVLGICTILLLAGCNPDKNGEETTAEENSGSVFTPAPDTSSSHTDGFLSAETLSGVNENETGAGNQESTSAVNEENTVAAENTTSAVKPNSAENTTAGGQSSSGGNTVPVQVPANNEYDILRSGNFYIKGAMIDENSKSSPLEMAVTPDSVFMLSEFSEGVDIGVLMADGTMYMIYPNEKAYMEMNDSLMKVIGFDMGEMIDSDAVDFSKFGSLSDAYSVVDEIYNGIDCRVYYIKDSTSGSVRVYMNGDKLMRFATYSEEGRFLSATEVDTISSSVPADKSAPPEGYKAYKGITGMAGFMKLMTDVI